MAREVKIKDLGRPLRIGEKVRIRSDLYVGSVYYNYHNIRHDSFASGMECMKGKVATISSCGDKYNLLECGYFWVDEMFDCLIDDSFEDDSEWELSPISMLI